MADLVDVANAFYRSDPRPMVVLTVDLRQLSAPWRTDGDERYPHVYGSIDRGAVTEVRPIARSADGMFLPIERPDRRRRPDMPELVRALTAAGVDFIVIGSSGAALLGAALVPGDLDVCVETDAANLDRLGVCLVGLAARPRVDIAGWVTPTEAAGWRPERTAEALELLFETPHGDLDILFASLGSDGRSEIPYADLLASAVRVDVAGVEVHVAAPQHLLESKLAARRPKDQRVREVVERLAARFADGVPR